MKPNWSFPARLSKADGGARRVGVEIEMAGMDIAELADLTGRTLGGQCDRVSAVEYNVVVPDVGAFRVEVDFAWLKEYARQNEVNADGGDLTSLAIELLGGASTLIVPCEIVTPPIPMRDLPDILDSLVRRLRAAGAKGTRQSMLYAFGVHLNVEPPDLESDTVVDFLRAFVCLYDWIVDEGQVDVSRQLSPYIRRYDRDYELKVANPSYRPAWTTLIDDYLGHNPSRDHALDMLPLFAHIDEKRVMSVVNDSLVKSRPAFHYRLANSCIDEAGWSIAQPWNLWVRIENLVLEPDALRDCAVAFGRSRRRMLHSIDKQWVKDVREWLID